ncbi:MAG: YjfB family protein [Clostridia bacterium]|nr:YjfB family protein [Clostridia bacterium]
MAALSVSMKQDQLAQQVGLAVMKKAMDTAKTNSEGLMKVMEQSVSPHLGNTIDIKI